MQIMMIHFSTIHTYSWDGNKTSCMPKGHVMNVERDYISKKGFSPNPVEDGCSTFDLDSHTTAIVRNQDFKIIKKD